MDSTSLVIRGGGSEDQSRESTRLRTHSPEESGLETQICSFLCTEECSLRFVRVLTMARKGSENRKGALG